MGVILNRMHQDHRYCDELFAMAEAEVKAGSGHEALAQMIYHMNIHFLAEEDILFPPFEAATGIKGKGPTEVMRAEHDQMRRLMAQLQHEASEHNIESALNLGETLMLLMQQHRLKEENVLYPMLDQHVQLDRVADQLDLLLESKG